MAERVGGPRLDGARDVLVVVVKRCGVGAAIGLCYGVVSAQELNIAEDFVARVRGNQVGQAHETAVVLFGGVVFRVHAARSGRLVNVVVVCLSECARARARRCARMVVAHPDDPVALDDEVTVKLEVV